MSFFLSSIISGHNNDVRSVASIQDKIVSGSRDGTARLWALEEVRIDVLELYIPIIFTIIYIN